MRVAVVLALILAASAAMAQSPPPPMSSPSWGFPMVPGSGSPMVPIAGSGGSGPPPTCSNAFDFSQACNSMYLL